MTDARFPSPPLPAGGAGARIPSPRPSLTRRKPLIHKGRALDKACQGLTSLDKT